MLEDLQEKSQARKKEFGVVNEKDSVVDHHKPLPQDLNVQLVNAAKTSRLLEGSFTQFTNDTNDAIIEMRKSLERVKDVRKQSSVIGSNVFEQLKSTKSDRDKLIFGKRAKGVWNDASLKTVE